MWSCYFLVLVVEKLDDFRWEWQFVDIRWKNQSPYDSTTPIMLNVVIIFNTSI